MRLSYRRLCDRRLCYGSLSFTRRSFYGGSSQWGVELLCVSSFGTRDRPLSYGSSSSKDVHVNSIDALAKRGVDAQDRPWPGAVLHGSCILCAARTWDRLAVLPAWGRKGTGVFVPAVFLSLCFSRSCCLDSKLNQQSFFVILTAWKFHARRGKVRLRAKKWGRKARQNHKGRQTSPNQPAPNPAPNPAT